MKKKWSLLLLSRTCQTCLFPCIFFFKKIYPVTTQSFYNANGPEPWVHKHALNEWRGLLPNDQKALHGVAHVAKWMTQLQKPSILRNNQCCFHNIPENCELPYSWFRLMHHTDLLYDVILDSRQWLKIATNFTCVCVWILFKLCPLNTYMYESMCRCKYSLAQNKTGVLKISKPTSFSEQHGLKLETVKYKQKISQHTKDQNLNLMLMNENWVTKIVR